MSLVNVVCYQVVTHAKGRSLTQRSPTCCIDVTECVTGYTNNSVSTINRYKQPDKKESLTTK